MGVILTGCVNIYNSPQESKSTPKTHGLFESPDQPLSEKCTLPAGVACLDFRYTGTAVEIFIQNGAGFNMSNIIVSVEDCTETDSIFKLINGQTNTFTIKCPLPSGIITRYIYFNYTNQQTGIQYEKQGEITLKIP